jgi:proteasome-associated ATPase
MGYLEQENKLLRDAIEEAKKKLTEQDKAIRQLLMQPTMQGVVVSIRGTRVLVSLANGMVEVAFPAEPVDGKNLSKLIRNGCAVRVITDPAPAIIDVLGMDDWIGDLAVASREGKNGECEVEWQGNTRVIRTGTGIKNPEPGDRLMVDERVAIAIKNLGPDESKFSFQGTAYVTWEDIGGLAHAKQTLVESIELPHRYPELFRKYNKKQVKGVLLYGPPGCGKTMLGKATATSIARSHGRESVSTGFIYVKGPALLDRYVGNTEAQVRGLFARARKHQKKHGYPAVLFIDEADALLGKRDGRPNMGIESTVVPQFLSEMDGLDETGPIVLLATNRPDGLDSAVTRDGRVDHKVQVTRPDREGAVEIFKLYLKSVPLVPELSIDEAAESVASLMYSDQLKFYDLLSAGGHAASFTLAGLANGAMIAGVVDKAAMRAMNRDIDTLTQKKDYSLLQKVADRLAGPEPVQGVTLDDLMVSVQSAYQQNKHLNHELEVQEFVEDNHLSVDRIIKAQAA